jgi:hypothetical protein
MPSNLIPSPKPFTIPWKCLHDDIPATIAPKTNPKPKIQPLTQKTFAQVLSNVCDIPDSQLPIPTLKGDKFSILIPDDEYDIGLDGCKYNLHAQFI